MAGTLKVDFAEVSVLVDALGRASRVAPAAATAVVAKGALNIKTDAARRISGHPRFRRLPQAIDYDLYQGLSGPSAEIGPNPTRSQGNLGHIAEFGSPRSAPLPYMGPAGEAEAPRFEKAAEDLMVKALGPVFT